MDEAEREAFYDSEIAPALAALAQRCIDNGLSLHAGVWWGVGEYGETCAMHEGAVAQNDLTRVLVHGAIRARGNVDSLVIALKRYCREGGIDTSGSFVLGDHPAAFHEGIAMAKRDEERRACKAGEG